MRSKQAALDEESDEPSVIPKPIARLSDSAAVQRDGVHVGAEQSLRTSAPTAADDTPDPGGFQAPGSGPGDLWQTPGRPPEGHRVLHLGDAHSGRGGELSCPSPPGPLHPGHPLDPYLPSKRLVQLWMRSVMNHRSFPRPIAYHRALSLSVHTWMRHVTNHRSSLRPIACHRCTSLRKVPRNVVFDLEVSAQVETELPMACNLPLWLSL